MTTKVEISQESLDFVRGFLDAFNSQDNRSTAQPYYYVIQEKVTRYVPDGHGDDTLYWDASAVEMYTATELVEYRSDSISDEIIESENWKALTDHRKAGEILERVSGIEAVSVNYEWETRDNGNVFFTEKAAKHHLEINGHNFHNETRTFVCHAFRNREVASILKVLQELGE